MLEILTPHDESLMPLVIGPPCRVAADASSKWGFVHTDESAALRAYSAEWSAGNQEQLALVSKATELAGFGDYPQLLRIATAKIVSNLLELTQVSSDLQILDLGSGPGKSAEAIYTTLPPDVRERTEITLLDPSADSLKAAEELMKRKGIKHRIVHGMDSDMLGQIEPGSFDFVTAVASIHHHARIPFELYEKVLKPGGYLIIADWHHDIWEHPGRVLRFLKRFDWPQKEAGLANWKAVYPQAIENPDINLNITPEELMAREQITRFWLAYKNIADKANLGANVIWPLEGHRPVSQYVKGMQEAGLFPDMPHQLLPDSTLLMVTVGHKPKR